MHAFRSAFAFCLVAGVLGALADAVAGETEATPPKPAVKLNNDAVYEAKLKAVLATAPAKDATDDERITYLSSLMYAQYIMRQFAEAEKTAREFLKLAPKDLWGLSYLSVFLARQGKYREAEESARKALEVDPTWLHAKLILASWVYQQGRKDEAFKLLAAIAEPTDKGDKPVYHGCSACFYATVGNEGKVEANMKQTLEDNAGTRPFFERDPAFDPYRGKEWFIKLVGRTLAEPGDK